MACVHYKFASQLNYAIATFDGRHISLRDLKKQIMGREKLKAAKCDLQVTNAQTEEEYTDDNALIPKNVSVIVRRIPIGAVISTSKADARRPTEPVMGTSTVADDSSASMSLAQLIKTANLAEANASEEDKIKAMMWQSCQAYGPVNYMKKPLGPPPPSYTCSRCGRPGHYIQNCPTKGGERFEPRPRIKRSTGIPRRFMVEVKDPNVQGAKLTNTGTYAVPTIEAEAYAIGKKERPPFLPEEPSSSSEKDDPIPDELLCPLCKDIVTDAAVIPCCANSYCDECIRTALLESEDHTCPTCHQHDVSPDALIANKFLRQAVINFTNGTGAYAKRLPNQLPPPPPRIPPPRPLIQRNLQPLLRSPRSRQQDPPRIPVTSSSGHPAPSTSSFTSNQSSLAPAVPGNSSAPVPVPDRTATVSTSVHWEKSDGPLRDSERKTGPATALASEHSRGTSSIAMTALVEEKGYPVPVLGTPSLLGQAPPAGYSVPPPGFPPAPANLSTPWVSSGVQTAQSNTIPTTQAPLGPGEEFYPEQRRLKGESTYPYGGSSYSRSPSTYSKSRSGSTRSPSYSRSPSRSHSPSYSPSLPYPRRGRGKSRNDRPRSRPHGYRRARSRSPLCTRCPSRTRTPQAFRGRSPNKRTVPQGETGRAHFNRYTEAPPPYDRKAYYGRSVDFRDPFENEHYRQWERKYREWYEKYDRGYAAGAQRRASANAENLPPESFSPLHIRNAPLTRGRREVYSGGPSRRSRNVGGSNSPEKLATRDSHNRKDSTKSREGERQCCWRR